MGDLLAVHEPSADGADESLLLEAPVGEGDQDVTAGGRFPDAQIPRLEPRVGRIGKDAHRRSEGGLDLIDFQAVLLALLAISRVPVETRERFAH